MHDDCSTLAVMMKPQPRPRPSQSPRQARASDVTWDGHVSKGTYSTLGLMLESQTEISQTHRSSALHPWCFTTKNVYTVD